MNEGRPIRLEVLAHWMDCWTNERWLWIIERLDGEMDRWLVWLKERWIREFDEQLWGRAADKRLIPRGRWARRGLFSTWNVSGHKWLRQKASATKTTASEWISHLSRIIWIEHGEWGACTTAVLKGRQLRKRHAAAVKCQVNEPLPDLHSKEHFNQHRADEIAPHFQNWTSNLKWYKIQFKT